MDLPRGTQQERLFYLEFLAFFTGQVGRRDLVTRFGISEPAATKDLSLYAELTPSMLHYDVRQKCYVYAGGAPYFRHSVDQVLFALAGDRALAMDSEHGKRLPSSISHSIKRKMPLELVATLTRCIYQRQKMRAQYTSLSSGSRERLLSPLAIVHDGLRWHMRCFDHEWQEHRDYNLARLISAQPAGPTDSSLDNDVEWNTIVPVKLVPHPKAAHPESICMDYEMSNRERVVPLRACLVGFFLRHWHVDCTDGATGNPKAQHLYLANKNELLSYKGARWAFDDANDASQVSEA